MQGLSYVAKNLAGGRTEGAERRAALQINNPHSDDDDDDFGLVAIRLSLALNP